MTPSADPNSDAETPLSRLTPDELQDLVVVAHARTMPEALYLAEALDEAGIPAATRTGSILVHPALTHGAGEHTICVPRALSPHAREVIHAARCAAEERGVEAAFDPDSIVDATYNVERDPVLKAMFLLREDSAEDRISSLTDYIIHWLTSGKRAPEMAAYLAAAGLSIDEAETLVNDVTRRYSFQIQEKRNKQYGLGVLFIFCGIVLFFMDPAHAHSGIGAFAIGLALTFLASRPLPAFTRSSSDASSMENEN